MKKITRTTLTFISNYSLPSSKSITLLVDSNCNQNNVTTKDDLLVFKGERTSIVATLALGSRPRQKGLARLRAKRETRESHHMLSGMQRV
jgi:hypothetical protein